MNTVPDTDSWRAALDLRFAGRDGETLLTDRRHHGPLRVQRPFYPESRRVCHVYLLHPPGGLVSGDRLSINIDVDREAWSLLTTPGATKFYRSDGRRSVSLVQQLKVADGGILEWLPQENIVFDGAHADSVTRVDLLGDARFIGWEINCLGRPASGERLEQCRLRQRFELWRGESPLWIERSRYDSGSSVFDAAWGLRSYSVVATLVCTTRDRELVHAVRDGVSVGDRAKFGVSQLDEVLVCRYLGEQAQEARSVLTDVWKILRPRVLGVSPVVPRIWNT